MSRYTVGRWNGIEIDSILIDEQPFDAEAIRRHLEQLSETAWAWETEQLEARRYTRWFDRIWQKHRGRR